MSNPVDFAELQTLVGYTFADAQLLRVAMTHRSYANERRSGIQDNEKLEFLGDAVLDLLIGHFLILQFPMLDEGKLSMTRSSMVSTSGLSKVARELKLGDWLLLGKGEERGGGRDKDSLLADALEALIAALYLDGGLEVARTFVEANFASHTPTTPGIGADHKTRLQQVVQKQWQSAPVYQLVAQSGPDHDKCFTVVVYINGAEKGGADGHSKKQAEQNAAAVVLAALEQFDP